MNRLRIAVTGGSGRIGSALIRHLLERGHQVVNLDIRYPHASVCRHVHADLTRREQVQPALEGLDAVCHLGEIPSLGTAAPEHVYAHNTAAGAVVMQTAADLGIPRLLYASSIQVYGMSYPHVLPPLRAVLDESHPLRPQQGYALSKVANEAYAQILATHRTSSVAILRLPWVCDIELTPERESEHWGWFESRITRMEEVGAYVHVSDAAHAMALAIEHPRPGCEIYQLCAEEGLFHRPVRGWMNEAYPDLPLLPGDWPAFRSPYSSERFRSHFPWQPQWNALALLRSRRALAGEGRR
jgi:nucleoside-diphosphate-sugar epimerase